MSTSPAQALATPFLGNVVEICIVTADAYKTMTGLLKLGIGPFNFFTFNERTVTDMMFRGREVGV